MILATKNSTPIIGQISVVMGWIMNGIYKFLDGLFGIQNLGLCIIIFSILIYLFMTPLQIKQQKFSKLSSVMQPELMKIQKKYKNKKDQASMQKMQEETSAVYQKYGVSPTGSCVQLLIQLPILWSLWHVIQNIPAYVGSVKSVLDGVASQIIGVSGYTNILQDFITDNKMTRVRLILDGQTATPNSVIDFLYALSPGQWDKLADMSQFAGFSDAINSTAGEISHMQSFLGLNIADMPWNYITAVVAGGSILLAIAALLIPILSWGTQVLNLKLMPQATPQNDDGANPMASSMKTMNMVMPLMSAFFCFTFPVGLGIYWISSAVVRSVQQVLINRHLNKMDIEVLINENMKKIEEKRAKAGLPPQKITNQAHQSVKNINKIDKGNSGSPEAERAKKVEESYKKAAAAKPDSITAKANLVRTFDERNKKK
ncbi:MAG: membrane protein insertase YidC [Blautia caecimuris]|uniref:YidC/Oxa1 family membrane protein insertase n=1 Tax=Blautia TaxID=572511 RepID=UPI0011063FA6|nr:MULTISPECIES: membrane protein insertase YidC [Blautia]MBS5123357.1 membrane protein insertase YidC [Blautia sp.]